MACWARRALFVLLALLAPVMVRAATVTNTASFNFTHAASVDSGLISVLGTFQTTKVVPAPAMMLPKFDPTLGTLTGVDVIVATTGTPYAVSNTGVLSLISSASVSRTLALSVVAGNATGSATNTVSNSGGALLTLLLQASAEIGGAPLNRTISFSSAADLTGFTGNGVVAVGLQSTDVLVASTLVSLANGAGFAGTGAYVGTVKVTYTYTPHTPVTGRLFFDDGRGGGTPNDGIANGTESGRSERAVRLLNASDTVIDSTTTAADGSYRLNIPATVPNGSVLRVQVMPSTTIATGGVVGNSGGTYSRSAITVTWTYTAGAGYAGIDFGAVPRPIWVADVRQTALPGTVIFYRHRFVASSRGAVTFSATHVSAPPLTGWTATLHEDVNRNGVIDTAELPITAPMSVTTGQVVDLIVRVAVPEEAPINTRVTGTIQASVAYTNASPPLTVAHAVLEITDVAATLAGTLVLQKVADKDSVVPGATIGYAITFTNSGVAPLTGIVITDATPAYTNFVSAAVSGLPASLGTPVTAAPAVGTAGAVTWTFPGLLQPGASGTVSFIVRVLP